MGYIPSLEEKEVVCTFSEATKRWRIYSSSPRYSKKISKLLEKSDDSVQIIRSDETSITIEVPENHVKISRPAKRNLSDEQRNALRERATFARAKLAEERRKE